MAVSCRFDNILRRRYSRRAVLRCGALLSAAGAASSLIPFSSLAGDAFIATNSAHAVPFGFVEPAKGYFTGHVLPGDYRANLVMRWGDRLFADAPDFAPADQSATAQARQFGYNNDFVAYLPFPYGSRNSSHGLLFVNHEFTNARLMFSGLTSKNEMENVTHEQINVQMQAHGMSVAEIVRNGDDWQLVLGSEYNRRVTATTMIDISGSAAGHARLKTSADTSGRKVSGTLANCGGGVTPWGTVLSCEENFDGYFSGTANDAQEARNHKRYGVGKTAWHPWHRVDKRFDIAHEPHEPNRFGWVVETDPYDPESTPVKRTALGRFKHESATCTLAPDGRAVVYSGDDERFEYIYRFVSVGRYNPQDRAANRNLLDSGTLSVAKFGDDGKLVWLPLTHGIGALTKKNGFATQADVLIEARRAADLLGATQMDRPEDIEVHPQTGEIFIALTNNTRRKKTDAANPRADNKYGHIITLTPPLTSNGGDHAAKEFRWDMFMVCGNPEEDSKVFYPQQVSAQGWFANPDNFAFDGQGNLWIATDGMPKSKGMSDGLYAVATQGKYRGLPRAFFHAPKGSEVCGPAFTPDGETLFLAIMHPGDDPGSNFDNPSTRWPDFDNKLPPRPSVIAITKNGGGKIGE